MNVITHGELVLAEMSRWNGGPGGWFWPVIPLLWITLIGLTVWFVTRRRPTEPAGHGRATALLAERYARGELSTEEYRERLDNL